MSIEARRGCGFRKCGGIYVMGDLSDAVPAEFLPFCCEFPFTRALQLVEGERLFRTCADPKAGGFGRFMKLGLMYVGSSFYTPDSFLREAREMGVSKRVSSIPAEVLPGDPVALAYIAAIPTGIDLDATAGPFGDVIEALHCSACRNVPVATAAVNGLTGIGSRLAYRERCERLLAERTEGDITELPKYRALPKHDPRQVAGVFCLFRMRAVEVVLPESVAKDPDIRAKCAARMVTIVAVPDDDGDHVIPGWKLPAFLRDDADDELDLTLGAVSDLDGVAETA